jgi:hypothetical protein
MNTSPRANLDCFLQRAAAHAALADRAVSAVQSLSEQSLCRRKYETIWRDLLPEWGKALWQCEDFLSRVGHHYNGKSGDTFIVGPSTAANTHGSTAPRLGRQYEAT